MERNHMKSQPHIAVKKSFPNLKSSIPSNKPLISLSRIDLDCMMSKDTNTTFSKQPKRQSTSYSHKRILSGMNKQGSQRQFTKTTKGALFHERKFERNRLNTGNSSRQNATQNQRIFTTPILQKAKVSSKKLGKIFGYGVNSHSGPLNTVNEDRVCIVTNLNKATIRSKQVSFFGIYDGRNGTLKAQFYRDNFHSILYNDEFFLKDIDKAIKRALSIIQRKYAQSLREKEDESLVNFVIGIVFQKMIILIELGEPKAFISTKLGHKIINPIEKKQLEKERSMSITSRSNNIFSSKYSKREPLIKIIQITQNLDYLVLGSMKGEGLFENFNEKYLGKKIWFQMLRSCSENILVGMGESINCLMTQVFHNMSTKNVSMILIVFESITKVFDMEQAITLPYITEHVQETKQVNDPQ